MELVGKHRGVVSVQRGKVVPNHTMYIIIDNNVPPHCTAFHHY